MNSECSTEERRKAVWLWNALEAEYPGRWTTTTGFPVEDGKLSVVARRWVSELSTFEAEDVRKALEYVTRDRPNVQFLPTLGEVISACKTYRRMRIDREDMLARSTRLPHKGVAMPAELSALIRRL